MSWPGRRARATALIVASLAVLAGGAVLWTWLITEVAAAPGVAGHHDFLAFHSAARLIVRGQPSGLYDAATITGMERQVVDAPVGAAGYMPYISPPFAAAVQAPLGAMPETSARALWLGISIVVAAACAWLATEGMTTRARALASLCLLATFPFFQAFVEGQWSFVMLLGTLLGMRMLRRRDSVAGGVALAVLALKPPLLIPVVAVLLWRRRGRAVTGLAGACVVVVAVTLPWTGAGTQVDYVRYLAGVLGSHVSGAGAAGSTTWEGALGLMEGINGAVAGYVGQSHVVLVDAVSAIGIVAVVVLWARAAARWARGPSPRAADALTVAGVAAVLLTDVHLYPQDCVLGLVALPALLRLGGRQWQLTMVVAMCAALDTVWLDQLPVATHLFVWILLGALVWGSRAAVAAPHAWVRRSPSSSPVSA